VNAALPSRPFWTALIAVPVLFMSVALVQKRIDIHSRDAATENEQLMLRSPALVKKLSLGYESLLADIYWTRAVQYYGARLGTPGARFPLLWPLLDVTTTLDPKMIVAYRFGSIFLSEGGDLGAGQTNQAVELVKRGIAANPDQWILYTDLGFLYYWRLRDYPDASATYLAGSKVPGAPVWLNLMAARIAVTGGSLETSRIIWTQLYNSTQSPEIRKSALTQIQGLTAQEDEVRLNELADQYRQRFGRYPASTRELKEAGLLVGIPVDPNGFPYAFGPDGRSRLSPMSTFVIPLVPQPPPAISNQIR
jgi:hypothetical protein